MSANPSHAKDFQVAVCNAEAKEGLRVTFTANGPQTENFKIEKKQIKAGQCKTQTECKMQCRLLNICAPSSPKRKKALYLSVNVFSKKVLIEDATFYVS